MKYKGNHYKVVCVLPAYNAEKTLENTIEDIDREWVDEIILVDDCSQDKTLEIAKVLEIEHVIAHTQNLGYGANQKTCYQEALRIGSDIIIMLHPDYQYTPKLINAIASMIAYDVFDAVIASRILGNKALKGGMPLYKYIANRFLTTAENLIIKQKLSEYHTGYRAFSAEVLEKIPLLENSDDFVFDNEMLLQTMYFGFNVGEVSCPAKYFDEASSISFRRSVTYGIGVIQTSLKYFISKRGYKDYEIFNPNGRKLTPR